MSRPNGTTVARKDSAGDAATPGCIRHTSIHKAKGLDSKAVSRARQLLAVVENG